MTRGESWKDLLFKLRIKKKVLLQVSLHFCKLFLSSVLNVVRSENIGKYRGTSRFRGRNGCFKHIVTDARILLDNGSFLCCWFRSREDFVVGNKCLGNGSELVVCSLAGASLML